MKETFCPNRFTKPVKAIIEQANEILDRFAEAGYDLTLRQLYYQFVAANLLPNSEASYDRLGKIITNARNAGAIDWNAIRDRGRSVQTVPAWDGPAHIIESARQSYKRDLWENQANFVLCMVEKQALEGVLLPVCERLRIGFSANKGYASATHLYDIGKTIARKARSGKQIHVVYLGDHDPSGLDMSRDAGERLRMYSRLDEIDEGGLTVHRVALNRAQVDTFRLSPNPAKETDSRAEEYIATFGPQSWELDALDPPILAGLVEQKVQALCDPVQWALDAAEEQNDLADLEAFAQTFK